MTLQFIPNQSIGELEGGLINILKLYKHAGFVVQTAIMDNEFEKLRDKLLDKIEVNTTAQNEHVGEIECKTHNDKIRSRSLKAQSA